MKNKKYVANDRVSNLLKAENNLIISGSEFPNCEIFVWALDYNPPLETFAGHSGTISSIIALNDGDSFLSASYDASICL